MGNKSTKCPSGSVTSAPPLQNLDFSIELLISREFFVITRGPGRLREVRQFGVLSPEFCSLAGTPAREPNTEGDEDAGEEENLPWVEEPFEKPADKFNCSSISTMP